MSLIKLQAISRSYHLTNRQFQILQSIDLEVTQGDSVALMGVSGSGKSTLMGIIGLLDNPSSGHYWLNGKNTTQLHEDEKAYLRNRLIGFVFQSFYLLPRYSVLENIALPLFYQENTCHKVRIKKAFWALSKVGLSAFANHYPSQLSGGEQQRIAIARAIVGKPLLLLADEPTGSLDSKTSLHIMDLLHKLNQEHGMTLFLVTHDKTIAYSCKRLIHLENGKITHSL